MIFLSYFVFQTLCNFFKVTARDRRKFLKMGARRGKEEQVKNENDDTKRSPELMIEKENENWK